MTINKDGMEKSVIEMQRALLGVASGEQDVLGDLKQHLDNLLDNVYAETLALQKVIAEDAMVSESPITHVDGALVEGIDRVSKELNVKNQEIKKLQRLLTLLGVETTPGSKQSLAILRQTLEELNKRNRILRAIQRRLAQHPLISGRIPKGITRKAITRVLEKLNDEIKSLNITNFELKQQIKMNRLQSPTQDQQGESKPDEGPTPSRRGPK